MALNSIKLHPQILEEMITSFIAQQSIVSDLNESSVTYELLYTFARALEDLHLKLKLDLVDIVTMQAESLFAFPRSNGAMAAGELEFTLKQPSNNDTFIPAGTSCYSASGVEYKTNQALTISALQTAGRIGATALLAGIDGNTDSNTITTLASKPDNLESVTNPLPFVGGLDSENDEAYLARFALYIKSLGGSNTHYIKAAALSVSGVKDCQAITSAPPILIEGQLYNLVLYIDDGAATASDDLIAAVQAKLFGLDTYTSPGILSGGIACYVAAAQNLPIDFAATITTDGLAPLGSVKHDASLAIAGYINSLPIGASLILSDLIALIKGLNSVRDVVITSPTSNTTASSGQVAKLSSLALTMVIAS